MVQIGDPEHHLEGKHNSFIIGSNIQLPKFFLIPVYLHHHPRELHTKKKNNLRKQLWKINNSFVFSLLAADVWGQCSCEFRTLSQCAWLITIFVCKRSAWNKIARMKKRMVNPTRANLRFTMEVKGSFRFTDFWSCVDYGGAWEKISFVCGNNFLRTQSGSFTPFQKILDPYFVISQRWSFPR